MRGARAGTLRIAALLAALIALPAVASDEPQLELTGMTFVGSEAGSNSLMLEAEEGRYDPKEHVVFLTRLHVRARGEDGRTALEMTSNEGRLWLDENDFRATGDVRGVTGDGRRFRTSWVRYDRERDLVTTDAPVVIEDDNVTLRGGGFRYAVREGNLRLVGGATVEQP